MTNTYKHNCAKDVLREWLEEIHETKWLGDDVHTNYQLVEEMKWEYMDSNLIHYNYLEGTGREAYYGNEIEHPYNPTYQECLANAETPVAILDIATTYKGCVSEGFIVYDENSNSEYKCEHIRQFANSHILKLYKISEDVILNHTTPPSNIYDLCETVEDEDEEEDEEEDDLLGIDIAQ